MQTIILFSAILLAPAASSAVTDLSYSANCKFYLTRSEVREDTNEVREDTNEVQSNTFDQICNVALFTSLVNFNLDYTADILDHDLCSVPTNLPSAHTIHSSSSRNSYSAPADSVAIARRGTCPFDQKFRNGITAGYKAVIIVNSNKEVFPPGPLDTPPLPPPPSPASGPMRDDQIARPCLLVGSDFWDNVLRLCPCPHAKSDVCDVGTCHDYRAAVANKDGISVEHKDQEKWPMLCAAHACSLRVSLIFGTMVMLLLILGCYVVQLTSCE